MATNASEIGFDGKLNNPGATPNPADIPARIIRVPLKTCNKCGETFINGYHGSVGIEFWLDITLIGGIVYWAMRGRGERCPRCKSKRFSVRTYVLPFDGDLTIPKNAGSIGSPGFSGYGRHMPIRSQGSETKNGHCVNCGNPILPDSNYCEKCGKKIG